MNWQTGDTIVAQATPSGEGAIGVIRLSGPEAIDMANRLFEGKDLSKQDSHTLHYGSFKNEEGETLDEVVISLFVKPHSYTKEDVVEISCHGSPFILERVLQALISIGARPADRGEFTLRAFLNGRMDLSQAEAVADLIASEDKAAHRVAMQQMRGGYSQKLKDLREKLMDFASLIELELDFSEEDVEFADEEELTELIEEIREVIQKLVRSFRLGNVLKKGVNTVIAGRPNAGKSTLLNALLSEERAIVSEIAGTTRDTIEEVLNIKGVSFRLIDTAGIRDAQDQIESIGVERTLEKIKQSALLVYLFDPGDMRPEDVQTDIEKIRHDELKMIVVANKIDAHNDITAEEYLDGTLDSEDFLTISALEGTQLEDLLERLYDKAVEDSMSDQAVVVSNARHVEALQRADEALEQALNNMQAGVTSDFIAMDIRQATHHLGEITGEITTDDLLGNIFSNFCIGK